jgi:hypothetical protein
MAGYEALVVGAVRLVRACSRFSFRHAAIGRDRLVFDRHASAESPDARHLSGDMAEEN